MDPESPRKRLPFEPVGKVASKPVEAPKKAPKKAAKPVPASTKSTVKATAQLSTSSSVNSPSAPIPEVVSRRMVRRMMVFSGIPTGLGVSTFFVSYYLVINQVVDFPPYLVLLLTLGCFGLGVAGLTYGVLSASWDEDRPGNRLGLDEFRVNFGRMTGAWGAKSDR